MDKPYAELYNGYIYSDSKYYPNTPYFIDRTSLIGAEGFRSLYAVDRRTAEAIIQEGSTVQFKGVVWSERLWIDVDSYEGADEIEEHLKREGYDYVAYDTGNRGVHFGILRPHAPSHLLPYKDKEWVRERFPQADLSIYTHLHLFRLEGTTHEKTGRRKERVVVVQGKPIELGPLKSKEVKYVNNYISDPNAMSVFDCHRVIANTIPVKNGNRHPTLVRLCYALRDDAKVGADIALWWLKEASKLHEEEKEEGQLEQIVRSIYGGV